MPQLAHAAFAFFNNSCEFLIGVSAYIELFLRKVGEHASKKNIQINYP